MDDAKAEELSKENRALDARIRDLESKWKIAIGVAVVLGIGGGWLGTTLREHQVIVAQLQADLKLTVDEVKKAEAAALASISAAEKKSLAQIDEAKIAAIKDIEDKATAAVSLAVRTQISPLIKSESEKREARDKLLMSWIRPIYETATDPKSNRAPTAEDWRDRTAKNSKNALEQLK